MENLAKYWVDYRSNTYVDDHVGGDLSVYGYTCPTCGAWVPGGSMHYCSHQWHWDSNYVYPQPNKTEQAFNILKVLVKEGAVKEPSSFKKFCALIEKIAGVV